MREHPLYPGLKIYEGNSGEKPRAAAFYQPKKGDTLSGIGVRAGIPWRKINTHPWNIKNLIEYRASSSSCTSKKLQGAARYDGFISLCPSVGYGQFQIIWIPPANGMGPDEILGQSTGLKEEDTKPPSYIETPVKDTRQIKASLLNTSLRTLDKTPMLTVAAAPEREVPWVAVGVITAITVGMFVFLAK